MKNLLRRKFIWYSIVASFLNYIKELILNVMALIGYDIENLIECYLITAPPQYIHAIYTYMHAQYNLTISPMTKNIEFQKTSF